MRLTNISSRAWLQMTFTIFFLVWMAGSPPVIWTPSSLCPGCARIKKVFFLSKLSNSKKSSPPFCKTKLSIYSLRPTLVANLYAYNPLMRLFRHFSTLLWENALFPSLPPPPSKSLAHSKSVNEPALLLVRNNKDYPRVGVLLLDNEKCGRSSSTTYYYCCCANFVPPLLLWAPFFGFQMMILPIPKFSLLQASQKCILFTAFGSSFKQVLLLSFSIVLCCLLPAFHSIFPQRWV